MGVTENFKANQTSYFDSKIHFINKLNQFSVNSLNRNHDDLLYFPWAFTHTDQEKKYLKMLY